MKTKSKFKFEKSSLNLLWNVKIKTGTFDVLCWNLTKNECGTIFGEGIDWETKTINKEKIGFLNTTPIKKGFRKDELVFKDFLNAFKNKYNWIIKSNEKIR